MTLFRLLLCISFSIAVVGCGDDSSADAAVSTDATADDATVSDDVTVSADVETRDATGEDAGRGEDAGTSDAAADVVDAAMPDTGSACETGVEDRLAGQCDGRGVQICTAWANENGGMNAVAQCTPPMGRCARADTCTEEGCMCGRGAECADTEMCVSGVAGFSCVCISPPR